MSAVQGRAVRRLVLVGGGHAHVLVLRAFARHPEPGVRILLVTPALETPYSGMLPGHVAGFYPRGDMHIDLTRLAEACGADMVVAAATHFDRANKLVHLRGREPIGYDLLSIDIGIAPDLSGIAGALEHALVVKPIGEFLERWARLKQIALTEGGPRRLLVVGGGAGGLCLVFAIAASLRREAAALGRDPGTYTFTLVSAEPGAELNRRAQAAVDRALERHRILVEPGEAVSVEPGWLTLAGGARIAADAVLVSTQAAPHPALVRSKWPLNSRGFLALRPTLQAVDDDDVFAAGDCATVLAHPRSKAGVFAVRQGPVLADNLRRRLRNKPPRAFSPQKRHLVLLSTADGRAIGARGRWAIEGGWVWWLKNRIDRAFMRRFR